MGRRAGTCVLGIPVHPELLQRWAGWLAPAVQPFTVEEPLARQVGAAVPLAEPPRLAAVDELRDTFGLYDPPTDRRVVWIAEQHFDLLPRRMRTALVRSRLADDAELVPSVRAWSHLGPAARNQADGHRFVWWPSTLRGRETEVLSAYVALGRRPSRHEEVPRSVWSQAATRLPRARKLAGRFPEGSGPNCFGAVMAAAGVPEAENVWMQREPFEEWLAAECRHGGSEGDPGTVLVWRSADGLVQHAAVTLGDGWALHKPSQGWMSPTKVLDVAQCRASARAPGRRLERWRLRG